MDFKIKEHLPAPTLALQEQEAMTQAAEGDLPDAPAHGKKNQELTEAQFRKFQRLAKLVKDDAHFCAILQTAVWDQRKDLYYQIAPYLKFKPRPFKEYKFV